MLGNYIVAQEAQVSFKYVQSCWTRMKKEEKTLHRVASFAVSDITLERVEKKIKQSKNEIITTRDISFGHPTNPVEQGLTLVIWRDMLLSLWYSDSTLSTVFCLQMIHFPSWVAHSHFDL